MAEEDSAFRLADFDRYIEEHLITEEDIPTAFAQWIIAIMDGRVPGFEKTDEKPRGG